jgi:cell division protein FtsZ
MSINIGPPQVDELKPRIAVIGVGGAGGNAIANMIAARVEGVDFIVANTDAQALNASPAERRIQLGTQITQGLGAGSRPEVGRAAAEESIAQVEEALNGAHMCFVAAGMGGGTGTGAAPVIAKAARDRGILTVGVVTKPFTFEGQRRMRSADSGIAELQDHVDTLIVIPNQNLFLVANPNTTFKEAFTMADEVLQQGVRGITDLMVMPGLINLDFADVRSVMREMGKAMMGTGEAEGDGRALEAAQKAIANPLLDGVSMAGAKGVIISITGGEDMRLMEVDEAANHIRELVDPDANIIWGSAFNDNLDGKIRVSVVATGIDSNGEAAAQASPATRSFSFAPARAAAPAPVAEETVAPAVQEEVLAEAASVDDNDPAPGFSLGDTAERDAPAAAAEEEPMELSQVAGTYDDTADELVLDAPEAPAEYRSAPAADTTPLGEPPARSVGGGTLFERMSRLSRGASAPESDDGGKEDGVDIPRFLGRQNNQ